MTINLLDLQLFAGEAVEQDGTVDDDPTIEEEPEEEVADVNEEPDGEADDDEEPDGENLKNLLYYEEDESEGEPEGKTEPEAKADTSQKESKDEEKGDDQKDEVSSKEPAKAEEQKAAKEEAEKKFSQEELEQIIGQRLSRDRQSNEVRQLQELTGMDLKSVIDHVKKNKITQQAEEMGITEEEAEQIFEKDNRLREMEGQMQQQSQEYQNLIYSQEKSKYLNDPLVKKYEKEIDEFSKGGAALPFEPAMNYILGKKVLSGEITKNISQAAEQKTLKNVQNRAKVAPVNSSQAGKKSSASSSLSKEERALAKTLGVTPSEFAKEKARLEKSRR